MYIAVCDDQPDELAAITSIIEEWRIQHDSAVRLRAFASADDMLEAARHQRFTLYLLDVMMPGIDGIAAAERSAALTMTPP